MLTIGLTGGIGSGKSTVANLFSELGIPVFDTDTIAKQLVEPGQPALEEIVEQFGANILTSNGTLDRQALKQLIFTNDQARINLEAILHPRIKDSLVSQIADSQAAYCIAVIPLLFEKKWQPVVDRILVVDVSEQTQLNRARQRDQQPEAIIKKIIASQIDRQRRLAAADDVIDNEGEPAALKEQVEILHHQYLEIAKTRK